MLRRAMDAFRRQTHPDREMIVVFSSEDAATGEILRDAPDGVVKVSLPPVQGITLGELRNIGVRQATGDYACTWDDDDIHHVERLRVQLAALHGSGANASVFGRVVLYDAVSGLAALSRRRGWEQTLLCDRGFMLRRPYPALSRGEDSALVAALQDEGRIVLAPGYNRYVYCCHDGNVSGRAHFRDLFETALRLSPADQQAVAAACADIDAGSASACLDRLPAPRISPDPSV